jgi:uncharacterized membrane protein YoaT (DUF817 family)
MQRIILCLSIYLVFVVLVGALWARPNLLLLCLALLSAAMLSQWHTRSDLIFYFVSFLLGTVGEILIVGMGAWSYALPLFRVPIWLPVAWGVAMLLMKKIAEVRTGEAQLEPESRPGTMSLGLPSTDGRRA